MSRIDAIRGAHGGVHPGAAVKVKDFLEPIIRGFIAHAPFVVMATANGDGDCDASPKGGHPGFVKVLDERTLLIPDIGGNYLLQGYENFESNAKVGLVFIIPGMQTTARVNGRVRMMDRAAVEAMGIAPELHNPDRNAVLVQGIAVDVDEAYLHCPRAFAFSKLWDAETIATNESLSVRQFADTAA